MSFSVGEKENSWPIGEDGSSSSFCPGAEQAALTIPFVSNSDGLEQSFANAVISPHLFIFVHLLGQPWEWLLHCTDLELLCLTGTTADLLHSTSMSAFLPS